jgi:hypothetical protein
MMNMAKKTEAKRTYKLDIQTVLEAADKGMKQFYENLTEEEQKAFTPLITMRWQSALSDKSDLKHYQILATNDLVNLGMWSLGKHPELLWKLLCVAGTGRKQYHAWIPMTKRESTTPKWDAFISTYWPHTNHEERLMLKQIKPLTEWVSLMRDSGADDRSQKDIRNEIQKFQKRESD